VADVAPLKSFLAGLMKRSGAPKVNGRPKRTSTIADLAPLPKGMQTRNQQRNKIPALPPLPPAPGKM